MSLAALAAGMTSMPIVQQDHLHKSEEIPEEPDPEEYDPDLEEQNPDAMEKDIGRKSKSLDDLLSHNTMEAEFEVDQKPEIRMNEDVIAIDDAIPDLKSNAKFQTLKRRHRRAKLTSAEKIVVMDQSPTWL